MGDLSCSGRLALRRHAMGCGRMKLNEMERAGIFQRIKRRPPKIEAGIELNRRCELDHELWVGRDRHEVLDPKGICCGGNEAAETAHATAFAESVKPGFDLIGCFHADESDARGGNLSYLLRLDILATHQNEGGFGPLSRTKPAAGGGMIGGNYRGRKTRGLNPSEHAGFFKESSDGRRKLSCGLNCTTGANSTINSVPVRADERPRR
jgi:hypothetical protein